MGQQPQPKPPLSPQQSFVVQFRADTGAQPAMYDGRVEHVISGQATLFSSPEELLTFITRVLADVRTEASMTGNTPHYPGPQTALPRSHEE